MLPGMLFSLSVLTICVSDMPSAYDVKIRTMTAASLGSIAVAAGRAPAPRMGGSAEPSGEAGALLPPLAAPWRPRRPGAFVPRA